LNKKKNQFVLIGLGSIGKKHAEVLSSISENLVCIDPQSDARDMAAKILPNNVKIFKSLTHASKTIRDTPYPKIGVIANLGPSHFKSICDLIDYGVKAFFVEKPICNSLESLENLSKICRKKSIKLIGGFQNRYSGIFEKVIHISKSKLGGLPKLISVSGGAMGMVTTGIHYLDLAIAIFQSYPNYVLSDFKSMKINPRSKKLDFWEGSAIWGFKNARLSINTSNHSSVRQKMEIFCPFGKILINEDLSLNIFVREKKEVKKDNRIIRLGTAVSFGKKVLFQNKKVHQNLFTSLTVKGLKNEHLEREFIATKAMIYALISSKKSQKLFINKNVEKKWYKHNWKIS